MSEEGHRYKFSPPAGKGWPDFDEDGKIVKEHDCLVCQAQQRPVPTPNEHGDDDFGGPA